MNWTIPMQPLSLTPSFGGVAKRTRTGNRFSGFSRRVETAKAVQILHLRRITPLKRGANETKGFKPGPPMKFSGW
jgi:hypothetical protein